MKIWRKQGLQNIPNRSDHDTKKNVTAHLNDLGLRVGVDILMVQNCKSGIILHQDNRIALDAQRHGAD